MEVETSLALLLEAGGVPFQILGQLAWYVRDRMATADPRRVPAAVEALGMKYVNIPMTGWTTKDSSVDDFMKIMNDPASGKVYVHCAAGKHRTGLVGAIYRLEKYGWDYDTAYKEMKNYEYYSGLFHRKIKGYVKDYYEKFGAEKQAAARAAEADAARKAAAAAGVGATATAN